MALTINGESIPGELIHEEFQTIKAQYERLSRVSCCERDPEFRGYAKDNIIARVLINQEAARRFPEISEEEITAAVERIMNEHGGRGAFFQNVGLTPDQEPLVREDARAGLQVDRLMTEVWGDGAPPGETAERAWYEAHQSEFMTVEEVSALHLFKQAGKDGDREAVYNLLRGVRNQVREGADFQALALQHTDKEDKLVDLGWFKRGDFMEEFDLIIFSLEVGETSPVFASHYGFHLAQVTGWRPPQPVPFEEVRETVRDRMTAEHRQTTTQAFVAGLRMRADIRDDSESPG